LVLEEVVEICLEIAKAEIPLALWDPVINGSDNTLKPVCVAALRPGVEATHNKEVSMHELMKKGGEE
jgi:hypothetical protein